MVSIRHGCEPPERTMVPRVKVDAFVRGAPLTQGPLTSEAAALHIKTGLEVEVIYFVVLVV